MGKSHFHSQRRACSTSRATACIPGMQPFSWSKARASLPSRPLQNQRSRCTANQLPPRTGFVWPRPQATSWLCGAPRCANKRERTLLKEKYVRRRRGKRHRAEPTLNAGLGLQTRRKHWRKAAGQSSERCTGCSDACLPRNCRWFKDVCVSREKKSKEPFSRAATILREKRRHVRRGLCPLSRGGGAPRPEPFRGRAQTTQAPPARSTPDGKEGGSEIMLSSGRRIKRQMAMPLE